MKNTFIGLIVLAAFSISCKKDERATYIKEADSQPAATINTPKASLMDQAGIASNPNPTPMATTPGMNPPHGQPGHRCDIPVGQPLNSVSSNPVSQNISVGNNNVIQVDPNAVSPGKIAIDNNGRQIKTAPGMNPPHGQSGHRCDIPVGQPLNSKPVAVQSPNIVQTPPPPVPAPAEQNLAMGEKPSVNPAHGEPWHNCAVKVGDPLP
ncbi:hypothetical protein [Chryseobacterium sp.]|uniref:hypothetical protein n=1 Tax=Chryseobacterium sp. TaxID=1871047 RepID=UPI0025BB9E41|nr:hypothetical protein [Chryseobacterium sp.]MBV8326858.1 hypothetical protein [Chryseobacterium sp.]